jgi:hypothetical protein
MAKSTGLNRRSALGAVEYDMHVLAAGLLLRRYPPLLNGPNHPRAVRELAGDAVLLKMRALVEFLGLLRKRKDRFTVSDFNLTPLKQNHEFGLLFGHISQRCAHLTKDRAREPLWVWPHLDQAGLLVLRLCAEACSVIRSTGLTPRRPAQRKRHTLLQELLQQLRVSTRSPVDAASWPSNQAMELTERLAALAPQRPKV